MKRRKWPTVPQILAVATKIEFRYSVADDSRICRASYDTVTIRTIDDGRGLAVHVHLATAHLLLKSLPGAGWVEHPPEWTDRALVGRQIWTPPPQTGASDAPSV